MLLQGMEVMRFPFVPLKNTYNTLSSTRCFIEYLAANEIIDQYLDA